MSDTTPKIIFMGTPEFAVPSLRAIHAEFGVAAVVTVPDKPKGRGLKLIPSEVKAAALELGIPVLQPESVKSPEFAQQIAELQPDIIAVIAFKILPPAVYSQAKLGAFNIHGSLLPKYRGAAPIQWAIINGEKKSGVTSFLLQEKVDTGAILKTREVEIGDGMTAGELYFALMPLAAELAVETCGLLLKGEATPQPQNDEEATPAPKLFREQCKIDWKQKAETVRNFIHGVSPVPGAWTMFEGKRMKILKADLATSMWTAPGEYTIEGEDFIVACNTDAVVLKEIQLEGKPIVKASDFVRGWRGNTTGNLS
ncbi:MAG TPA: methionyl-tRNA formyltransferase [Patescibacteria group bacterium]|nr:methionyl-tRNA formyltransferase [Patescibacteria group bacterium]